MLEMAGKIPGAGDTLRRNAMALSATAVALDTGPVAPTPVDVDETVLADDEGELASSPAASAGSSTSRRTTVLPRRRRVDAAPDMSSGRPRFERVRTLGEGAMGEVELARDNDIRRTVALKRMKDDTGSGSALLRFADEVRIVGQLEHPGIVPIYDVGRDESGRVYLVMKHLCGQTMEQAIEELKASDPGALEKYGKTDRVRVFLGVLDAIRYAHARGVIHRDIKPANIMIGPYGEVTVLDWGIAKPLSRAEPEDAGGLDATAVESQDTRLLETKAGSLAGTPLYMSPEQAAGRNDEVDVRSDTYALTMVLYEWLTLRHPLSHFKTVNEVLASVITHDYTKRDLVDPGIEAGVPIEYLRLCLRGLARDRDKRFQSVDDMESALRKILSGQVHVECPVTFSKRALHELEGFMDRHPMAYMMLMFGSVLAVLSGVVYGVVHLVAG